MALLLLAIVLPVNSAEVIVSPRISSMSYERLLEPESLSEQLGLDQESLITSTSIDDVNGQLVLDRLIALSDPDYMLVPGDTISVSYIERAAIDPVTLLLTVPYGGRLNISNIATIETDGKTFQNVRSEIEAALLQYSRYANPIVTINSLGMFRIELKGEVTSSRTIRVNGNSFLSDILYYGSGSASSRSVTVKSADGTVREYDPYLGLRKGESANNPRLRPGDVITLNRKDRAVTISGAVNDSGTYQILEGENLSALISDYAKGLDPYASSTATLQRSNGNGYYEVISVPLDEDFELKDGDIIYIEPAADSLPSVSIEGALRSGNSTNNMIQGDRTETYYYRFVEGESVYDMLSAISDYLIDSSNLEGAYLVRDGKTIMLDFNEILYNGAESGNLKLKASDRFFIPFMQMHVSVTGGVENPGLYGYVPGRDAEYYINLAGGYSANSKGEKGTKIYDKSGMRMGFNDPLTPESKIEVDRDDLSEKLASTVTVVALVTSIVGLVASIVTISSDIANFQN